jgi:hypothetical protein
MISDTRSSVTIDSKVRRTTSRTIGNSPSFDDEGRGKPRPLVRIQPAARV